MKFNQAESSTSYTNLHNALVLITWEKNVNIFYTFFALVLWRLLGFFKMSFRIIRGMLVKMVNKRIRQGLSSSDRKLSAKLFARPIKIYKLRESLIFLVRFWYSCKFCKQTNVKFRRYFTRSFWIDVKLI